MPRAQVIEMVVPTQTWAELAITGEAARIKRPLGTPSGGARAVDDPARAFSRDSKLLCCAE